MADLSTRFHAKYQVAPSGCWEWTAYIDKHGYGRLAVKGVPQMAYRVAYELLVGAIPDGFQLDHLCRNRACVNPAHLEPVTQAVNKARGERAMKTHCPKGHPYSGSNLIREKTGRKCRICHAANQRARVKPKGTPNAPALMAAKTHCPKGHAYDEANTYLYITRTGTQNRQCRQCKYGWKVKQSRVATTAEARS